MYLDFLQQYIGSKNPDQGFAGRLFYLYPPWVWKEPVAELSIDARAWHLSFRLLKSSNCVPTINVAFFKSVNQGPLDPWEWPGRARKLRTHWFPIFIACVSSMFFEHIKRLYKNFLEGHFLSKILPKHSFLMTKIQNSFSTSLRLGLGLGSGLGSDQDQIPVWNFQV